ncbi:MAG: type II secretion system protein GspG [Candidatus Hinthialibacter antarcticus]|nr:type II secretion system protein GspG [Candidatus Hinthialibacter antarcticus]
MLRNIAPYFAWIALPCLFCAAVVADVVFLKDGARLRCEIVSPDEAKDTSNEFIQIRLNQSLVWLKREAVERIEETENEAPSEIGDKELVQRLIDVGYILPEGDGSTPPAAKEDANNSSMRLSVKSIRGWAYVSDNRRADAPRDREPLQEKQEIPLGRMIVVSGNSRVTLNIEEMGEIGLLPGARIRFDQLTWDPSVQNYRIHLRLENGGAWFDVGEGKSQWRRVILSINTVQTIMQSGILLVEATQMNGGADLHYLQGTGELRFWRGSDPYMVAPRQSLRVSPDSNKLNLQEFADINEKLTLIQNWAAWQPEPLGLSFDFQPPPLNRFHLFGPLPALYPHKIPIDLSIAFPPIALSMGEVFTEYKKALDRYKFDTGKYPTQELGLDALQKPHDVPGWKGPYLKPDIPLRDMWGKPFVYDYFKDGDEIHVSVRSFGPNQHDDNGLLDDLR